MGTLVSTTPAFYALAEVDDDSHDRTTGAFAYVYRPELSRDGKFKRTRLPLDQFFLFVHRSQWRLQRGAPVRSGLVTAYRFGYNRFTGRVFIDARADPRSNTAVWEVVAGRPDRQHAIDPRRNRAGARAAILLRHATLGATRHGHATLAAPEFPGFLFAFPGGSPPIPERTAGLAAAVRTLHQDLTDVPDAALPETALNAVFDSLLTRDGALVYAPSWLFAREPGESHPVHPRNGTPAPTGDAPDWTPAPGQWIMVDGRWVPEAQRPLSVVADLSAVLGRESCAAWEILVEGAHLPSMPYADWASGTGDEEWERFRDDYLTALFPGHLPDGENELINEWRRRNAIGAREDDAEVAARAFEDVRRPVVFPNESRIGVVGIPGRAGPETMSYRGYGFDADLYSLRSNWEAHLAPAPPADVDRARRRLASPRPARRHRGHASRGT